MSFWNELAQGFIGQPVMPRPVPEYARRCIRRIETWLDAKTVSDFLKENFGDPPKTPVLKIPPSELIGPEHLVNTFAYYLPTSQITEDVYPAIEKNKHEILVGTVRYKLWARSLPINSRQSLEKIPENCQNIYTVDCFCVDRRFRSKGKKIGTWLLKYLHYFANTNSIPYAVFMKEGAPLSLPVWPFRSGIYAWMRTEVPLPNIQSSVPIEQKSSIQQKSLAKYFQSLPIKKIPEDRALLWLHNYYNLQNNNMNSFSNQILQSKNNPKLYPMSHNCFNSAWYLYRDGVSMWILIRIENTNQENTKNGGGNIGYITDVYASNMYNSDKNTLSSLLKDISNFIAREQLFHWIWIDSENVNIDDNKWKTDGPYNWYAFQW